MDSLVPRTLEALLVPGAAVALIQHGEVVWQRGYGFADRARQRPVTAQTVFNIGSLSKTVTAWGVLRLVQSGRVDLDRSIASYLTRWHLPLSTFGDSGVTLRRVLSHTAGLSLPSITPYDPGTPLPTLEQALSGTGGGPEGVRVVQEPGTSFRYSGGGYDVLQLLVEEVTGASFNFAMTQSVLEPLGMMHSAFGWTPELEAASATPYNALGDSIPSVRFTEVAAAGFATTASDLARLGAAELAGPNSQPPGRGLLSQNLVRAMESPASKSPTYGLGHEVLRDSSGLTFVGHNGANRGWIALLQLSPASGDGLVILTNSNNGWALIQILTCRWERSLGAGGVSPYCDPPGARYAMYSPYRAGGVATALNRYDSLQRAVPNAYSWGPAQLVSFAYDLLHADHRADAVRIFEESVSRYPSDWNSHDSLGEAYLAGGDTTRAIREYKRSVELNPQNTNGIEVLKRVAWVFSDR